MRLLVLGSGAGGGLPQWNALNTNGRAAFERSPLVPFRTQCSIAATVDGASWALFNAAPDLRHQILANPQLHPRIGPRSSPIKAVLLTGAEIDQVTGLFCLRERHAFTLYGSATTLEALALNPVFEALAPEVVTRVQLDPGGTVSPVDGLHATALDIPGKPPLYLERTRSNPLAGVPGDCFAYVLEANGRRVVFAPGVAQMTEPLAGACESADLVLVDGTLFRDDEMIAAGEGAKTGRRMGHLPMTGDGSMLEAFAALGPKRKIFIHINNTNPALRYDSPERAFLADAGWEIAEDGMEIAL
ncbi:MAG: pyrroloquinoline quinone biosynthesis protein PqqB [Alphaproteobacteria bacterium]|nr:pyrroloquinoline quinone biosynthesis protein PqqB [Alphaproteobacteria bacterium]